MAEPRSLKPVYYDTANQELVYQNNNGGYDVVPSSELTNIVLTSPDDTDWEVSVNDAGALTTTEI